MDDLLTKTRLAMEPEWDEVREARVLARILDEADIGSGSQHDIKRSWTSVLGWAGAAAVALGAIGLGAWLGSQELPATDNPVAEITISEPEAPQEARSEIVFSEGTRAVLTSGALVETLKKSDSEIHLRQSSGEVLYEVNPERGYHFEVDAHDVELHVVGTAFGVTVDDNFVSVKVTRGVVKAVQGERTVELRAGDDLKMAASAPEPDTARSQKRWRDPVGALLRKADQARRAKKLGVASDALAQVAYKHTRDARSVGALFTLGRIQRAEGDAENAAKIFLEVRGRAEGTPLVEDALAEEAISWARAGQRSRAKRRAKEYLKWYPKGPHVERLKPLAK